MSASTPGCLPHLLSHLRAPRASDGNCDASFSVPGAGLPGPTEVFPVRMAHLLAHGMVLGWGGPDGAFQLHIPGGEIVGIECDGLA